MTSYRRMCFAGQQERSNSAYSSDANAYKRHNSNMPVKRNKYIKSVAVHTHTPVIHYGPYKTAASMTVNIPSDTRDTHVTFH